MKLNALVVFALFLIIAGVLGICGCAVTVQPTSGPVQPSSTPYYQPPPSPIEGDVSYFYDQLAPYGEWFQLQNYGWVWTPYDVPLGWRPYTDGTWAYSDYGWTWVSDWEWGWAPFHYGRWLSDPYRGWVWVPGRDWAPAWVAWHYGNGWVGWAPLPPGVDWRTGVNIEAYVRPHTWCFVEERFLFERNLRNNIVLPARNITYLGITRNVTNYTMIQNRVFNRSLDVEQIERTVQRPIPRYRVVDRDAPPAARDRVRGSDIYMFRRQFTEATPSRSPSKVEPHKPVEAPGGRTGVVTPQVQRPSRAEILQRQGSELRQLNARHQEERVKLQEIHQKEIMQPPKGTPLQVIQRNHEAERRALDEQHQQEKKLLQQRHEKEQK